MFHYNWTQLPKEHITQAHHTEHKPFPNSNVQPRNVKIPYAKISLEQK